MAASVFGSLAKSLSLQSSPSEKTPNGVFVSTHLLPAVLKLQKEIRGRKYKEVQTVLQNAINALQEFEKEDWPPKPVSTSAATIEQDERKDKSTAQGTTTTEASDTTVDSTESPLSSSRSPGLVTEDDPQTREAMHPAIELTLEAMIAILSHPAKVAKACEYAMDVIGLLVNHRYVSGRAGGQDDASGSGARSHQHLDTRPPPASVLHRVLEAVAKCSEIESTQICLIKTLSTIMTSPKCGVHEASMLLAFRSTFHIYLVAKSPPNKESAKAALVDMLRSVVGRMEAYEAVTKKSQGAATAKIEETKSTDVEEDSPFVSQYHADSYTLFRSLCKMSAKELDAENEADTVPSIFNIQAPSDPMSLNGKILALELILTTMDLAGPAFCESDRFIYLVQHYLCVSLLKNCVSNHTQVAYLSQKIFLVLVYKFKGHLKQDIEVFMSNVFLRVLESQNSSFKQKALVLESLRSLCKDPVLLTQIFLNYDCDFEARNLYKEIVHILTKLGGKAASMPSSTLAKSKDAEQDFELSLAGLEVLMTILKAFLKALGLPGSEDDDSNGDSASARIRGMLNLDIGLAAIPKDKKHMSGADSVASDELSGSGRGVPLRQPVETNGATREDAAGKIVDAFQQKRNAEQNFETGAVKFTISLKSGLNFFIENGFVELDARELALFFLNNKDKLDKTQMGEALGREPDASFVKGEDIDPEKGGPGFWFRILHHYVDALDFSSLVFDDAIRLFLSGFRLPGEAQKIDRIMEKFAERFTAQNPEVFPSADTAFILAFSVIMLNTDLHNPSIKPERRMTTESFIRNNRGIGDNGSDLPEQFLIDIFNRIKERPFSLKEDDAARERATAQKHVFEATVFFENSNLFGANAEEKRRERFKKERDEMMAVTQQLARRRDKNKKATRGASDLADTVAPGDVVMPMFDVTWGPMLGILSQVLECSDDDRSSAVCLNGFVYAVRIAAHGSLSLARDTFVSSLAKFTFLGSIKEMKRKNIESIRTLLSIAVIDGEYLGESWGPVLQCISQVARLRLTASGLASDESFLLGDKPKAAVSPARTDLFRQQPSKSELAREAEENNAHAVLEAVQEILIDRVFSSTVNLSANSLAHFIQQLIAVSSSEIAGNSKSGITGVDSTASGDQIFPGDSTHSRSGGGDGPSVFSLQKLVEVADYNMDIRPRLVWAQVWEMMAEYFAKIACHKNVRVSFFAVDSLKQLSLKFLEKPELAEFNFQRLFLKPFLVVMEDTGSTDDAREMVLRCIDNIIRTKSRNLRSGWKIVFSILRRSARDPYEKVDYLGLSILQHLLDEHLHEVCSLSEGSAVPDRELSSSERRSRNANVDDFVGLCRASLSFVHKEESDSPRPIGLSMRAFSHTAIFADLLAEKRVLPPVSGAQSNDPQTSGFTYKGLLENEALEMALWRPLFEGLAAGVRSSAKSSAGGVGCLLQRSSVLGLRAILLRHGHLFSKQQWLAILTETLIPAIQEGAEADSSPVGRIISESPTVSNIDFLVESLPLPPPADDPSLIAFKGLNPTPNRDCGPAELVLEASFSDLRHGGDGDLRKAYALAKRDTESIVADEQPFPDSWIATTAPIALGLLTDILSEIAVPRGSDVWQVLWPHIEAQYKTWIVGCSKRNGEDVRTSDMGTTWWQPCEALVRVAIREVTRCTMRLADAKPSLSDTDASMWTSAAISMLASVLFDCVNRENSTLKGLLRAKRKALNSRKGGGSDFDSLDDGEDEDSGDGETVETPSVSDGESTVGIPNEVTLPGAYWESFVPELKIQCIAAHCVHHSFVDLVALFLAWASKAQVSLLLDSLSASRLAADTAVRDEDVATAFQEALFSDWGDGGVEAVDEALESAARLSHLHGSGMFFLAQEASATNAIIRLLAILFMRNDELSSVCRTEDWDREAYADPLLLSVMADVHAKFLASEEKDGHLIDRHVWRNVTESGGKVALYCTSFAVVIVEMLKIVRDLRPDQFQRHKESFFPMSCALIRVQSEEMRQLVSEILTRQVGPLIGVEPKA